MYGVYRDMSFEASSRNITDTIKSRPNGLEVRYLLWENRGSKLGCQLQGILGSNPSWALVFAGGKLKSGDFGAKGKAHHQIGTSNTQPSQRVIWTLLDVCRRTTQCNTPNGRVTSKQYKCANRMRLSISSCGSTIIYPSFNPTSDDDAPALSFSLS
ncbi:hypothetical protein K474DRAFT_1214982 [Panus rudis PR-1116 ss-1]|nr:hypothetical protein K474DRAFT_1214982 [Panus rudis PR-1116 ss-1]